ncbi:MAG: hypothetical protein CFE24_07105 [Flavobacterium sp. BFFFF2]|nr:MAG: hypothetical protein CFE24_07105 [Flavobacterium sp. BFFFF2]
MKKIKLKVVIFLISITFYSVNIYCQNGKFEKTIFSYKLLGGDSLNYKLIEPNKFRLLNKKYVITKANEKLTENIYLIDSKLDVKYYKFDFYEVDSTKQFRDKIQVRKRNFVLDSLFYGEEYFNKPARMSLLNKVYKFSFLKHNYLCFFFQDITNPDSMLNTNVLLLDITNKNKCVLILSDLQASEDIRCFGDFNKDKVLDYVAWSFGDSFTSKLSMYELHKNKFVLNKMKYIIIEDGPPYYIDISQSNWWWNNNRTR